MNAKLSWLGLALLAGIALATWLLRGDAGSTGTESGSASAARPAPARREPLAAAGSANGSETNGGASQKERAEPRQAAAPTPPHEDPEVSAREREFIARLFAPPGPQATEQERLAWEGSAVSDLLYPPGHACAGEPLDSVSPEMLTEVGRQGLAQALDAIPDVDEPQCLFQGRWNFHPLNTACSSVTKTNLESVERCAGFLRATQQDPAAYPASIWLPCGSGGQPTTRREFFENLLNQQVNRMFANRRCAAR
jgi:hypothetical protein